MDERYMMMSGPVLAGGGVDGSHHRCCGLDGVPTVWCRRILVVTVGGVVTVWVPWQGY